MVDHNIYFLAVARVQGEGIVVASHANDCEVEVEAVASVLEQPGMSIEPGKHYSFESGNQAWHLIGGTFILLYILYIITYRLYFVLFLEGSPLKLILFNFSSFHITSNHILSNTNPFIYHQ